MLKEINGLNVNYEVRGDGDETVVFVHGLGGTLNVWNGQANVCSRFYKTITYDLRGSGRTDISDCNYSMKLWAEDLKSLLEVENVTKAHLVGWSMGTLIVQTFAETFPEMVASQTLIGPLWEIPAPGKQNLYKRAATVEEEGMDAVADAIIEGGISSYSKYTGSAMLGMVREMLQRNDKNGYAASCRALADGKAIDHSKVDVPTLLIVGDEDNVTPVPVATKLYNAYPNADLKVIANCGHWTTVEKPAEVNQQLLSFLKTRA